MKRKVVQPDHCDWRPLRVPRGYKENYDQIEWEPSSAPEQIVLREGYKAIVDGTNNPFRLVKIEKFPFCLDCNEECDLVPSPNPKEEPDLYRCRQCGYLLSDEDDEIEWLPR